MTVRHTIAAGIALALAILPVAAAAQESIMPEVVVSTSCGDATFDATITGGTAPYDLLWEFGDGETAADSGPGPAFQVEHEYTESGEYIWTLSVTDSDTGEAVTSDLLTIGPLVTLMSDPFPPLVTLVNGEATVNFMAEVDGGKGKLNFAWDFDGDGVDSNEPEEASFSYTAAGKYLATVAVTDECGLTGMDTLPVVVIDPEAEACHPTAQRIADAINTLFPLQALDLYTCEDIFGMFRGGLTGSQLGFGRLWHAYKLAETIQEMTWEEIRDWHLDGNGWGGLVQLNRFAELLEEHSVRDLVGLVMSGEASIRDVRHSIRSVTRYDADFEDALARLGEGMSPGELGRFYRTAQDLGIDPGELDPYLVAGSSLQELAHAARLGERTGSDWSEIAEAHAAGHSWGAINQAQRMAEDGDWMSILTVGVRETRELIRESDREDRDKVRMDRTAAQLAARFGVDMQEVLDLYNGDCAQAWSCVRKALRGPEGASASSGQDEKTASRLARQYGVDEPQVWSLYNGSCAGSWSCVRAELRGEAGKGPKQKD